MTARKPRYRVRLVRLHAGWTFDFADAAGSVGGLLVCVYTTERAAQAAARRLLAAIRAGDVDETEIGG